METYYYLIAQAGFILLTIICFVVLLGKFRGALTKTDYTPKQQRRYLTIMILALAGWCIFVSALSLSGFLLNFSTIPPRMAVVLVIPLVTIILFTRSTLLKKIVSNLSIEDLTYLQSFRFFVEILLWLLFLENLLPVQMTFEGFNFDVVSGITAPIVAYFFRKNKTIMIGWNVLCLALLINIVSIAVMSMPWAGRVFMNDPANTIVAHFPMVLLPAFLVPLAYMLHFFSLRKLVMS